MPATGHAHDHLISEATGQVRPELIGR
jgi:hypothetical protein